MLDNRFDAVRKTTSFLFDSSFNALKAGEATLFALAPLPLQPIKTGIQQVALPLFLTVAAERLPGADSLINSAIDYGGGLMSSSSTAIAAYGLSSFGQAVSNHLPNGLGIHYAANGIGQAIAPVVLGGVERGGQFLGELSTGVLLGRTLINAGQQGVKHIREIAGYIGDALYNVQDSLAKVQTFLAQVKDEVSNLLKGAKMNIEEVKTSIEERLSSAQTSLAQAQNFLAQVKDQVSSLFKGESKIAQNTTSNEARDRYVSMMQAAQGDSSLTYDSLAQKVSQNPSLGSQYDQQVVKQALSQQLTPESVTATIAQGPHVQNQLNSDKQQDISGYLSEILTSYKSQLDNQGSLNQKQPESISQQQVQNNVDHEAPIESNQNGKQPESSSQEMVENNVERKNPIESDQNGKQPEPTETVVPDSHMKLEPETSVPKSSKEAEDYALGIVQLLDQRRVNVDRLQIDVNGQTVFKMHDGDIEARKTAITGEHVESIKKALSDPASFKGSVKISQGTQILLHVKDGRVLIDSVGITKQSAKVEVNTPESPSQGLYERFSEGVERKGLQATQDVAANALKAGVKREEVKDMLKARDPGYIKLAQTQGEKAADKTLEKVVASAEVQLLKEQMLPQPSQEVRASKSLKA